MIDNTKGRLAIGVIGTPTLALAGEGVDETNWVAPAML